MTKATFTRNGDLVTLTRIVGRGRPQYEVTCETCELSEYQKEEFVVMFKSNINYFVSSDDSVLRRVVY